MLLVMSTTSFAQSGLTTWEEFISVKNQGRTVWQLDIDNDSLLLKKDDGFYTSGNSIGEHWVRSTDTEATTYGWTLGQELYTNSDIKLLPSQIAAHDHPYAGWVHLGMFRETQTATGVFSRFAVDIGCLGPCATGEWSQKTLHRIIQQPLPQGWSTQVHQEWGVVLAGEYSPGRFLPMPSMDLTPKVKIRFGNIFTDASTDLTLRYGRLNALPLESAHYFFLRGELKAVGYNASLQGGYFAKQETGVHAKSATGELELGYVWQDAKWGASASIIRRSNEIVELSNGTGAQNFARLQFTYAY